MGFAAAAFVLTVLWPLEVVFASVGEALDKI